MAATPNRGARINFGNVGPWADIVGHAPVTPTNAAGGTISQNGGRTENKNFTSSVTLANGIQHYFYNCNFEHGLKVPRTSGSLAILEFCGVVAYNGNDGTGVQGPVDMRRCELAGFRDLVQPSVLYYRDVECLFHSALDTATHSGKVGKWVSHPDPIQFNLVYSENATQGMRPTNCVSEGSKFLSWPWPDQRTSDTGNPNPLGALKRAGNSPAYWENFNNGAHSGTYSLTYTAGLVIIDGNSPPNANFWGVNGYLVKDYYVDGLYNNGLYLNSYAANGYPNTVHRNVNFVGGQWKKRIAGYAVPNDGRHRIVSAPSGQAYGWANDNLDVDTGNSVQAEGGAFTGSKQTVANSPSWPSFFDTNPEYGEVVNPPPPPGEDDPPVVITSPASESTHTSGSVLFTGTLFAPTEHSWADFYIKSTSTEPGALGETWLDRDNVTNITGYTFTASTSGVTFTRRGSSTPETHPPGEYQLIFKAPRPDGSTASAIITVTFGDDTPPPPPTDIRFSPTITATLVAQPKLDTSQGGIPKAQIRRVAFEIPTQTRTVYKDVWVPELGGDGSEVVPINSTTFRRKAD